MKRPQRTHIIIACEIFIVAVAFEVARGLLSAAPLWYPVSQPPYYTLIIKAQLIIAAVSLFVTMYMESKRLSLKEQLVQVLAMLFLGSWFGLAIGKIVVLAVNASIFAPQQCHLYDLYGLAEQFVSVVPSVFFLVFLSFTALSLAYIRKH